MASAIRPLSSDRNILNNFFTTRVSEGINEVRTDEPKASRRFFQLQWYIVV
jgi:hypothetical protein